MLTTNLVIASIQGSILTRGGGAHLSKVQNVSIIRAEYLMILIDCIIDANTLQTNPDGFCPISKCIIKDTLGLS